MNESKTITLSLAELVRSAAALQHLVGLELPIVWSYRLGAALEPVGAILKRYETARLELYKRYAELSEDGGTYTVRLAESTAFQAEYDALGAETVELPLQPLPLAELAGLTLKPQDAAALSWLLQD